jgi:hypothetical protein
VRILASAQPCGFGPVSKLVAVGTLLGGDDIHFVGQGSALDFARAHPGSFARIDGADTGCQADLAAPLAAADLVVSVMDADLAFWAVRAGVPVRFFDSLFSFWIAQRPLADLVELAGRVAHSDDASARAAFLGASPHERVLLAHLLAEVSYVQNFPGVPDRLEELRQLGVRHIRLTGSMVDAMALERAATESAGVPGCDLLVNLGGFKNFYLDYESRNAYLRLMERWAQDLTRTDPRFERVTLCCGAYQPARRVVVGAGELSLRFLTHAEFLAMLVQSPLYAAPPSLTSLHEAVALGRMPLLLPEQHYGHVFNLRMLDGTVLAHHAASLLDLSPVQVPDDDWAGTRALDQAWASIAADPGRYRAFRRYMDARLEGYGMLSEPQRLQAIRTVGRLLDGPSLAEVLQRQPA